MIAYWDSFWRSYQVACEHVSGYRWHRYLNKTHMEPQRNGFGRGSDG